MRPLQVRRFQFFAPNRVPMIYRLAPLVLLLSTASEAAAQRVQSDSMGRFAVEIRADPITDEDRSWAAVADNALGTHLYWGCAGPELAIQLQPQPAGAGAMLTWRFDRDEPQSAIARQGGRGDRVTRLEAYENHAFTRRARTARELVIRQMIDGREHDWFFDLRGSDQALGRLACVRELRPSLAGTQPDLLDYRSAPSALESQPRPLNVDEVAAAIRARLPDEARRAGGSVELRLRVEPTGQVYPKGITAVSASGPVLAAIARDAVLLLRFDPARVNGRPVRVWVYLPLYIEPQP